MQRHRVAVLGQIAVVRRKAIDAAAGLGIATLWPLALKIPIAHRARIRGHRASRTRFDSRLSAK